MRRVYLDKCLFSYLEKNEEFTPLKDFFLSHNKELLFPYSPAHMKDFSKHPKALKYQNRELDFMELFCDKHLIMYNKVSNRMEAFSCTPKDFITEEDTLFQSNIKSLELTGIFKSIKDFFEKSGFNSLEFQKILEDIPIPITITETNDPDSVFQIIDEPTSLWNFYKQFPFFLHDILSNDSAYRSFRKKAIPVTWQITDESQQWKAEEVIDKINRKLKEKGINETFFELTRNIISSFSNPLVKEFLFKSLYVGLDLFQYKSDGHNLDSILRDAEHSFYAAHCDYFISSDKKLIEKSKAIYKYFNIQTGIIHLEVKQTNINEIINKISQSIDKSKDFQLESLMDEVIFKYDKEEGVLEKQHKLTEPFLNFFNYVACLNWSNKEYTAIIYRKSLPDASFFVFITELEIVLDDICLKFAGDKQLYKEFKNRFMQADKNASISWDIPNSDFIVIVKVDLEAFAPVPEIILLTKQKKINGNIEL